jgi:flavodoxin
MNALVVCYSRSGNTLAIAQQIAEQLQADTERIQEPSSRRGMIGFLRSGFEAFRRRQPQILAGSADPTGYDLVVIGAPIWAGRMASPIRTYLQQHSGRLPQAAFFCTSGGGGYQAALAEMAEIAQTPPVATLELTQAQIRSGEAAERVGDFAQQLRGTD